MAAVDIPLADFGELCRLCGSKTTILMGLHIFDQEGNLRQIYKKLTTCLPIQVTNDDKLPKMVCEECVYKLDAFFEFREKSLKTEFALNLMLKSILPSECNDPLEMQMETLICNTGIHQPVLPPPAPGGVSVPLDHNSIIGLPINNCSQIKCEPEAPNGKNDKINKKLEASSAAIAQPEVEVHEAPPCRIDNQSCSMGEQISGNIQVTDIRTLQTIGDNVLKIDEGSSDGNYLLSSQPEQPWFFCDICGKPFANSDEFQAHCEIHWKKCQVCGVTCANDDTLLVHINSTHQQTVEPIKTSPKSEEKSKVEATKKENSGSGGGGGGGGVAAAAAAGGGRGEKKCCLECGKEYRTNYKLAEHMRKHTGEKPFSCSMCEKTFRSKIGLAQHEARHTGHYDYTCNTCGKGFQCKSYLIVHQRVHSDLKPYPCDTCGRNFKTKQSLLDHQNRHLGVKPYLCETCGRGFITKGLCKSHQKVHSGTDNRQYPCSVCKKLFVSKSYLATHMKIHTGEKPFMCEVCGKGFLTRVDLKIHSTMHTGEKSFVCEVCGKAFARRDALRCHKRSHTGERPYKCDVCGQGFTQFSPMAIHKRLHTGERPYSCDICSKTFVSRSTMMSHRKKHNNS